MAELQYHKNDCEECAPLIGAFERKFGRQPDLSEFVVCFFRWANSRSSALEGRIRSAEHTINEISFEELSKRAKELNKCG